MSEKQGKQLADTVQKVVVSGGGKSGGKQPSVQQAAEITPYSADDIRQAINSAKPQVDKRKTKKGDFAAPLMAKSLIAVRPFAEAGYKSQGALEKACKGWFDKPSSFEEVAAAEARTALANPEIEYGAAHGDLHFISKPTEKKSAWTLGKSAALILMRTEIEKHLGPLGTHSGTNESPDGWTTFYVTGEHDGPVGNYYVRGDDNGSTTYFSMQVQVNYKENVVSYHGYPDNKMDGNPKLGCKKSLFGPALK